MSGVERPSRRKLQVGGAVPLMPDHAYVYIERPADDELFKLLRDGGFCSVLSARQMGKTSLLYRTQARLNNEGYNAVEIDLNLFGSAERATDWYVDLLQEVADQSEIEIDVQDWWEHCGAATNSRRLIQFLLDVVLNRVPGTTVIFLDELDSTFDLPYADDFFLAIRSIYNQRAKYPDYGRLVFCLVGVVTRDELIQDRYRTPFNIGHVLELSDLDPDRGNLTHLYEAVADDAASGEETVRCIVRWTSGHPYLTVKLCEVCSSAGHATPEKVDSFMQELFATRGSAHKFDKQHFLDIESFMNKRVTNRKAALRCYRKIRRGRVVRDKESRLYQELRLSGLVKRTEDGRLVVRNKIYEHVFTDEWAREGLRALARPVRTMAKGVAALVALVVVLLGLLYYEVVYPNRFVAQFAAGDRPVKELREAHRKLRAIPLWKKRADDLWTHYWKDRMARASCRSPVRVHDGKGVGFFD